MALTSKEEKPLARQRSSTDGSTTPPQALGPQILRADLFIHPRSIHPGTPVVSLHYEEAMNQPPVTQLVSPVTTSLRPSALGVLRTKEGSEKQILLPISEALSIVLVSHLQGIISSLFSSSPSSKVLTT